MSGGPAESAAGGGEGGGGGGEGFASDIPASATYRIELPEFEGPLDLLLHLCKTHEINVVDLPIAFITEKYLAYLDTMQSMAVEVAAEYLVMAATLAYLKARELVPNPEPLEVASEDGEELGDPREELIRRLLEYQKYKDAAEQLGGRPIDGRNIFGRGMKIDAVAGPGELAEHSVWKLIESFADLLQKAGTQKSHDVVVDRVSLSERINQIVDRLQASGGSFRFDTMVDLSLSEIEVRNQLVVTLLAILELAKLRVIRVLQDPTSELFFIAQREGSSLDAARRAQATSDIDSLAAQVTDDAGAELPDSVEPMGVDGAGAAEVEGDPFAFAEAATAAALAGDPAGQLNVTTEFEATESVDERDARLEMEAAEAALDAAVEAATQADDRDDPRAGVPVGVPVGVAEGGHEAVDEVDAGPPDTASSQAGSEKPDGEA
jgi:segregation and condensation protein A